MRLLAALWIVCALATPAAAQVRIPALPEPEPTISPRVFVLGTLQKFAAADTFDAAFGQSLQPFLGGGLQVAWRNGFFVDGAISFFHKSGERAFVFEDETVSLGVPLETTIIPFEATVGYRFRGSPQSRVTPYVGGGVGAYSYKEESDPDDEVSIHKAGVLALAGVEYRVSRRMWTAFDVQYSHVPGILGDGGLSAEFGEDDLGGLAVRFRFMVGN
jgi:opacity protein-like surface antigen